VDVLHGDDLINALVPVPVALVPAVRLAPVLGAVPGARGGAAERGPVVQRGARMLSNPAVVFPNEGSSLPQLPDPY